MLGTPPNCFRAAETRVAPFCLSRVPYGLEMSGPEMHRGHPLVHLPFHGLQLGAAADLRQAPLVLRASREHGLEGAQALSYG